MSTYSEIQSAISEFSQSNSLKHPVAAFVGATSGIGLYTALQFAKATSTCPATTIYIVGRNELAGKQAGEKIKELNPNVIYHFLQHDLTYIEQAKRVANIINNNENKLNFLLLSQGCFPTSRLILTDEGIDKNMALSYYTRWSIVTDLIHLLEKASLDLKEPARVVSVRGAGLELKASEIDVSDLDFKNSESYLNSFKISPTYNTLACFYFASKHPSVAFIHTYPGFVQSNVFRDLPWYLRTVANSLVSIGSYFKQVKGQEQSGNEHLYVGLVAPQFATGAYALAFDNVQIHVVLDGAKQDEYSPQLQESVWKHTENVIESAISKDQVF